jgi:hypothetical protein
MRERGERETHLISGVHGLSRGEEASDLIKVTILGSGVDGPSGTSERGRGRAHGCYPSVKGERESDIISHL